MTPIYQDKCWLHCSIFPLAAVPNFVEICHPSSPPAGVFYTVGGLSARATEVNPIHHIVIYREGQMVHDPHPAGGGLLTQETCWFLERG